MSIHATRFHRVKTASINEYTSLGVFVRAEAHGCYCVSITSVWEGPTTAELSFIPADHTEPGILEYVDTMQGLSDFDPTAEVLLWAAGIVEQHIARQST